MTTLSSSRRGSGSAVPSIQRVVLLPGGLLALLGGGSVAWLLAADPTGTRRTAVLGGVLAAAVLVLIGAAVSARSAQRRFARASTADLTRAAADVANTVAYGDEQLRRALEELRAGRTPQAPATPSDARKDGGPFGQLLSRIEYSQLTAYTAVTEVAELPALNGTATHQVTVLVNLARRLQSLVHQGIKILDELEQQVEDPDLLRGLFEVDHIATRIRRYVENVAVLGGEVTRRQWRKPVPMASVIRSAIGEVERYSRVKPVPPVDGRLDGAAVADVVHLLAELIENATAFSPPGTQVYVRTQRVTTGLVVEIEDRGLGQLPEDERMRNALLANPERVELGALLKDGRVGLYVVAVLARQHAIRVELRRNLFGGVTSLVLLPNPLLRDVDTEEEDEDHSRTDEAAGQESRRPAAAHAAPYTPAPTAVGYERSAAPQYELPASEPVAAGARQQQAHIQAHSQSPTPRAQSPYQPQPQPQFHAPARARAQTQAPMQPQARTQTHPQTQTRTQTLVQQSPAQAAHQQAPEYPQPSAATAVRDDGRPALPQRTQQSHMAPQLQREPQAGYGTPEEAADYTPANPGLMATYRRGVRAAEEQSGLSGE